MRLKLLSLIYLILLFASSYLYAQESYEDDLSGFSSQDIKAQSINDDLAGFGDVEILVQNQEAEEEKQDSSTLSGNIAFKSAYGYKKHSVDGIEYGGFNQAQSSLYLQCDSKLPQDWKLRIGADVFYDAIYHLHPKNNYRRDILDAYETQARIDDAYLQGTIGSNLDIKLGRQIVVWGKSDSIRITDVINPIDNRLPGMTDIEDLRLSTGMAKVDYYKGEWNFSFMAIGESRIMLEAPPRSEFFPVDSIFPAAPDPFMELVEPKSSWENMQYAFAANGIFSGWDLSFYAARVLDQKWHIQNNKRVVGKINMLGFALNIAEGNWLFKSELAFLNGVRYNTTDDSKNRLDALAGFDYMGFSDTVISIEVANRHIFNHEAQMSLLSDFVDKNEMQSALRITRSFLNDTLKANALLSILGSSWENGGFARVWVEYDIIDNLSTNFGVVEYIGGDKPLMQQIKDNDRIFVDLKYNF